MQMYYFGDFLKISISATIVSVLLVVVLVSLGPR